MHIATDVIMEKISVSSVETTPIIPETGSDADVRERFAGASTEENVVIDAIGKTGEEVNLEYGVSQTGGESSKQDQQIFRDLQNLNVSITVVSPIIQQVQIPQDTLLYGSESPLKEPH